MTQTTVNSNTAVYGTQTFWIFDYENKTKMALEFSQLLFGLQKGIHFKTCIVSVIKCPEFLCFFNVSSKFSMPVLLQRICILVTTAANTVFYSGFFSCDLMVARKVKLHIWLLRKRSITHPQRKFLLS